MKKCMVLSMSVFWGCLFLSAAQAEKRIALVMGNSAYQNVGELANPANDARLIAKVLRTQNFEVIERLDLTQKKMKRAFTEFTRKLKRAGRDTVGFVFYAGHGLQVRGLNYLVPIDARIEVEGDVDIEAISANSLLFGMKEAGNRMNVIIFDACRNNPYRSLFSSGTRGLAQMGSPRGSLVAFSTAPGSVAADGNGKNSPYSVTLAKFLVQPGLGIEQVFKATRQEVFAMTKERQLPWESSSLIGNFYPAGAGKARNGKGSSELSALRKKLAEMQVKLSKGRQQDSKTVSRPPVASAVLAKKGQQVTMSRSVIPELVDLPGGLFNLGCVSGLGCEYDEHPVHKVRVGRFSMSKYEITFAQCKACLAEGGCTHKPNIWGENRGGDAYPVTYVNWHDAVQYVHWLSKKTGQKWRLPTEAEWEYAARGEQLSPYHWGDLMKKKLANCRKSNCGDQWERTSPVGSFAPNKKGSHDMLGNVREWVSDWYGAKFYKKASSPSNNPAGPATGKRRVRRGGSWNSDAHSLRISDRYGFMPDYRANDLGFRLVREAE